MEKKHIEDFIFGLNCDIKVYNPWDCFHRHDEIEMTFFLTRKPVVYRIGGRVIEVENDDTILFWGAIPHQIVDIEKNVKQYWLTIPPHVFLRWDLPEPLIQGILNGSIITEHDKRLRAIDLAAFPVWTGEAKNTVNEQLRIALYHSLEARIHRFGGGLHSPESFSRKALPAAPTAKANTAFLRIFDYISRNFKTEIHVAGIARHAGLHPKYATALFRKESGINIVDFIMMLRVYEAQKLLLSSDMKIIDIAMEAGFGSMSNFYKCFKKICGNNPGAYRKELEGL
jgi:AraC-like DNA-binding protein